MEHSGNQTRHDDLSDTACRGETVTDVPVTSRDYQGSPSLGGIYLHRDSQYLTETKAVRRTISLRASPQLR